MLHLLAQIVRVEAYAVGLHGSASGRGVAFGPVEVPGYVLDLIAGFALVEIRGFRENGYDLIVCHPHGVEERHQGEPCAVGKVLSGSGHGDDRFYAMREEFVLDPFAVGGAEGRLEFHEGRLHMLYVLGQILFQLVRYHVSALSWQRTN